MLKTLFSSSVAERDDIVFVLGGLDGTSSKGRLKGTGLYFTELYSSVFPFYLGAVKLFDSVSEVFNDGGTLFVI